MSFELLRVLLQYVSNRNADIGDICRACEQMQTRWVAEVGELRAALGEIDASSPPLFHASPAVTSMSVDDTTSVRTVQSEDRAERTSHETVAMDASPLVADAQSRAVGDNAAEWAEVAQFQRVNFGCWPAGRYGNSRLRAWVACMRARIASGYKPEERHFSGVSVSFPLTDDEVADNKLVLALHNALALCDSVVNAKREVEQFDGENERHRSVAMNALLRLGGTTACNIVHDIVACRCDPAARPRDHRLKQRFKEVLAHYGYFGRSPTGEKRKRPYRWDVVPMVAAAVVP